MFNRIVLPLCSAVFVALLISFLQIDSAVAGCRWDGTNFTVPASEDPIRLASSGYKMLANKVWVDDARFPVGTMMGTDTITLTSNYCAKFHELIGQQVIVVYKPPIGKDVRPTPTGYRIPSDAPGVEFDISFANIVGTHPEGLVLAVSADRVNAGGTIYPTGGKTTMTTRLTISLIKSGPFTEILGAAANKKASITANAGLGTFTYYGLNTPGVSASNSNQLRLPDYYFDGPGNGDFAGSAGAPNCEVVGIGAAIFDQGLRLITLLPVNASEFSGRGAIDKNANSQPFKFVCNGFESIKPQVYFEATYPFNSGIDGVGMPSASSDIGVQILLNGAPVAFGLGGRSAPLNWNPKPYASKELGGKLYPADGQYCLANCSNDMNSAEWVLGSLPVTGHNLGLSNAILTFKYYQTTDKRPQPKSFSVPFTVSLDIP